MNPKFAKYDKMLSMLPEGAVRQKMMMDGIPQHEQDGFFRSKGIAVEEEEAPKWEGRTRKPAAPPPPAAATSAAAPAGNPMMDMMAAIKGGVKLKSGGAKAPPPPKEPTFLDGIKNRDYALKKVTASSDTPPPPPKQGGIFGALADAMSDRRNAFENARHGSDSESGSDSDSGFSDSDSD